MDGVTKQQIWRGLVDYANAMDLESNPVTLKSFAETLFNSMPWMARTATDVSDVTDMIASQTNPELLFKQLGRKRVWQGFESAEQLDSRFRQQAIEYRPQVRQLLTWLSDPERNQQFRANAFTFLREHSDHIQFQRGDPALVSDEDEYRYFTARGELKDDFPHRTLLYKDVADVICDFVQREHEHGIDAPIRICMRPGCGNPVVAFKKRQYCRTAVCDQERQKRDDDVKQRKNRDSVFLSRLSRTMPPAMRRKKARESAARLREIEEYWRDKSPSLARHAADLLKRVSP